LNIDIDGIKMNYIVEGEGENILILHGWGTNIQTMMPVHNILKGDFKVYTIDFPGFGESPEPPEPWGVYEYADYIKRFIDEMDMDQVTLIGHSFGGRISLILSNRYPELVKKMVLIDAAGLIPRRGAKYYFKVYSFKAMKKIYNTAFFWIPKEKRLKKFYEKFGSQDYRDAGGIMRQVLVKTVNEDLRPLLKGIKASTLLVWGRNDDATPVYMAEIMNEEIPDSGLVVLEDAGHYSYIDQYGQFKAVLESFFNIGAKK
jgi:pimeloyl-ACP methyl ester carboxylesterase